MLIPILVQTCRNKLTKGNYHQIRKLNSKIPAEPVQIEIPPEKLPKPTQIDDETIEHLERLSLVNFANIAGIRRLEEAIKFADQIRVVDTSNVEPLVNVLEDFPLVLRDDEVTEGNVRSAILQNAAVTEDDYFVAPPGNIPLKSSKSYFEESNESNKSN